MVADPQEPQGDQPDIAGLRSDINAFRESVDGLRVQATRSSRMVRILSVSVVIELALLALAFFGYNEVSDATDRADRALRAGCEAGNDTRAGERDLWAFLLALPSPTPRTAQQEQQVEDLRQFVQVTFAERDCSHLAPGG